MKAGETLFHEIDVFDDGSIYARRKDKRPLTDQDRQDVEEWTETTRGVTAAVVLRIFPGAKVMKMKVEAGNNKKELT